MTLFRFLEDGKIKPGLILGNGDRVDVSGFTGDFDQYYFENHGLKRMETWVEKNRSSLPHVPEDAELVAPISLPRRIICVNGNVESETEGTEPSISINPVHERRKKNKSFVLSDFLQNHMDSGVEAQLAIVLGHRASYLRDVNTWDYIAGYTLYHPSVEASYSHRRSGITDNPEPGFSDAIGPFMATKDEVRNVQGAKIHFQSNGKVFQVEHSKQILTKIPGIVSYLSEYINLVPGDVIALGVPAGLGMPIEEEHAVAA